MFKKNYYHCYEHPIRSNSYTCKKFDNFFDADHQYLRIRKNSICNSNGQIIEVCENLPEFMKPMYIRYQLIKSKFDFSIRFEDQERARRRTFTEDEIRPVIP